MKKYILAVDQSTSNSKAFLVDKKGNIVKKCSKKHIQYYPVQGRAEHSAEEIYQNVLSVIESVTEGIPNDEIAAFAITNQRETTVIWDRKTGFPVCPAVVWQDSRGIKKCEELKAENDYVLSVSGSDLSPYLPGSKISVLLEEEPELKKRAESGELCMGTIESYLIFRLTGGNHVSDLSNASRTQLFNIKNLKWDEKLLKMFGIPESLLPKEVLPCDSIFGYYKGIPITGVLGDSFGTLFGQGCHTPGTVKLSYGTGTSVMMNLGDRPDIIGHGLTTAIAYSFGGKTAYEVEGNITCSGDTLVFLVNGLGLFKDPTEIEALAKTVPDTDGVCLVPAMAGLGAPFFDPDARALICGMSRGTTKAHIARAALTSMAERAADVCDALKQYSGYPLKKIMVDGGGSKNELLVQLQSDLTECELYCSDESEFSALGASYMAGLATGFYESFERIQSERGASVRKYAPKMDSIEKEKMRSEWRRAIEMCRMK